MHPRQWPPADDRASDPGTLVGAVWRAQSWIIPLVAILAVTAFVALRSLPPLHRAEAHILVDAQAAARAEVGGPARDPALVEEAVVAAEARRIGSRDLARRVIATEHLGDVPEIAGTRDRLLSAILRVVGLERDPLSHSAEERAIDAILEGLRVEPIERSRVVRIMFSAEDPGVAARVANAVVREYMRDRADAAEARAVSVAIPPREPHFPNVPRLTAAIALAGFLAAVAVVVLRQILFGRSRRAAAAAVEPPPLALPPPIWIEPITPVGIEASAPPVAPGGSEAAAIPRPGAAAATLWSRISAAAERGRLVSVTSAVDAATAFVGALALGRSASGSVSTVCLVALSGQPREAGAFGPADAPGIGDLFAGRISYAGAIHRDPHSRLHVLPRGSASEEIDPERCRATLEALAASYEHIIVDAGAITEADPFLLALILESHHVVVVGRTDEIDPASATVLAMLRRYVADRVSYMPAEAPGHRPQGMAAA